MSLILDALNRAEHERNNTNAVPDIHSVQIATRAHVRDDRKLHRAIILLLCLIMLALIGFFFYQSRSVAEKLAALPALPAQPASTNVMASSSSMVSASPTTEPARVNVDVVESPSAAVAVENTAENTVVNKLYDKPVEQVALEKSTVLAQENNINQLYAVDDSVAESESIVSPFENSETINALEREATQLPTAKVARYFDDIQELDFNELALNHKKEIPTLNYSRHFYEPHSVSTIVLNGQSIGEGSALNGELLIKEIFVDGVVIQYRGRKFKLKALNGWINM